MSVRRDVCCLVFALSVAGAVESSTAALPEGIDRSFPITSGGVGSLAITGDTLFVGGSFGWIGEPNGGAVALDAMTGAAIGSWPRIHLAVLDISTRYAYTSMPDGEGGCYVGGSFTAVSGLPRAGLVHIRGDGSVDGWIPTLALSGQVRHIVRVGGTIYVAGTFTSFSNQARNGLAAIDATTGGVLPWNPAPNSGSVFVQSMVTDGTRIYVAGSFTALGGQPRNGLAALDPVTGNATAWNPAPNSDVYALVAAGGFVYAGGRFTSIGGQARTSLAQLDATDGSATPWNPNANSSSQIYCMALRGSTLYVGGPFSQIGGATRDKLAAVDVVTGIATSWQPPMHTSSVTRAIATDDSKVYLGGWFTRSANTPACAVLALDPVTGLTTHWSAGASEEVTSLATDGSRVFATGTFAGCDLMRQQRLAAIDLTRGQLLPWQPNVNGMVAALSLTGSRLIAGGYFTAVDGQDRGGLAAFDRGTGSLASWNPSQGVHNGIDHMAALSDKVYVNSNSSGAVFGGNPARKLAALDATSGSLLPWDATHDGTTNGLVALPSRVFVLGEFTSVNGVTRRGVGAVDPNTGALLPWDAQVTRPGAVYLNAAAVAGRDLYFMGTFEKVGGLTRGGSAAVDTGTAAPTPWTSSAPLAATLAVSGADVLAGWWGSYYLDPGVGRNSLLAMDATTGTMRAWFPHVRGYWTPASGGVFALATRGDQVIAGGTSDLVAGEIPRPGLVRIRPTDVAAPAASVQSPAGAEAFVIGSPLQVQWDASDDQGIASADVYLSRTGPNGAWELLAAAVTGRSTYEWTVTPTASNDCWIRVDVRDHAGHTTTAYSASAFGIVHTTDAPFEPPVARLTLEAPSPNPVAGQPVPISFSLPNAGDVHLVLVDVQGREVAVLLDAALPAGRHTAPLTTSRIAPGLYFLKLRASTEVAVRRVGIVR